jgi:hypothetical protein
LGSARIVCGASNKLPADEQAKATGDAWERLPEPKPRLVFEIVMPDHASREYILGPHAPRLREEDNESLHKIWLELTRDPKFAALHHYDVVWLALKELQQELDGDRRQQLLKLLEDELRRDGRVGLRTPMQ